MPHSAVRRYLRTYLPYLRIPTSWGRRATGIGAKEKGPLVGTQITACFTLESLHSIHRLLRRY